MSKNYFEQITDRAILSISGIDAFTFLQGLLSNNVNLLKEDRALYSLMLTPQGKFLYDFYLTRNDSEILIDCSSIKYNEICKKFALYKLRSNISINQVRDQYVILTLYSNELTEKIIDDNVLIFLDPRYSAIGFRVIVKKDYMDEFIKKHNLIPATNYKDIIYNLAIPLPDIDLISEKSFPLEFGLDNLNAISFDKGCYVGQELTARTKHRGVVRKKIYKISAKEDISNLEYGNEITIDNCKVGIFCSGLNNKGKALIREEDYQQALQTGKPILLNDIAINLEPVKWM
jgi:folate-binding protein YgfZ